MNISKATAIEFIFSRLRDLNDSQMLGYLQRITESRCRNKVLEDVMEELVDLFHELDLPTDGYYGHNFLIKTEY